jgi:hypothetical protein
MEGGAKGVNYVRSVVEQNTSSSKSFSKVSEEEEDFWAPLKTNGAAPPSSTSTFGNNFSSSDKVDGTSPISDDWGDWKDQSRVNGTGTGTGMNVLDTKTKPSEPVDVAAISQQAQGLSLAASPAKDEGWEDF